MKRRTGLALLGVAAIAVVVENVILFGGLLSPPAFDVEADDEMIDSAEGAVASALEPVTEERIADYIDGLSGRPRSPFLTRDEADELDAQGLDSDLGADPVLVLFGTLWSRGQRIAWINGHSLIEGDTIGNRLVESIEQGAVVLRTLDSTLRIILSSEPQVSSHEWSSNAD